MPHHKLMNLSSNFVFLTTEIKNRKRTTLYIGLLDVILDKGLSNPGCGMSKGLVSFVLLFGPQVSYQIKWYLTDDVCMYMD